MIALIQKTHLLTKHFYDRLTAGRLPNIPEVLDDIRSKIQGQAYGLPLTQFRAAAYGYEIGGKDGKDIQRNFEEIREDLEVAYEGAMIVARRTTDIYDLMLAKRDRLDGALLDLKVKASTYLAESGVGSRSSVFDSFTTLDFIDPARTTTSINLEEGTCTLPIDDKNSIKYLGSKVRLVSKATEGAENSTQFLSCFSPYRMDGWYVQLPQGKNFSAIVNVTGADYAKSDSEEVYLNAITIDPIGPLKIQVQYSPDGLNWLGLRPTADKVITKKTTFHFQPVLVGYLRFSIWPSQETGNGVASVVGIRRIDLLKRGYVTNGSLYSKEFRFNEAVHTVVTDIDADIPEGTSARLYIAQSYDGPWTEVYDEEAISLDTITQIDQALSDFSEETEGDPASLWYSSTPPNSQPSPNSGEMIAGRDQLLLSSFPYDWRLNAEWDRLPTKADWDDPKGVIRSGCFNPAGQLGEIDFITNLNPFAYDESNGHYLLAAIIDANGAFVLQPGYNYRIKLAVRCRVPITLLDQSIGVVNTGGTNGITVAPVSVYLNGSPLYQQKASVTSVASLATSSYRTTFAFQEGWNEIEVLIQVPADTEPSVNGVGASSVYLYWQPDVFAPHAEDSYGMLEVRGYKEPWKRYSDFDLRYNVKIGVREAWAWRRAADGVTVDGVLFNHNPGNDLNAATPTGSKRTVDGFLTPYATNLDLSYTTERQDLPSSRSLFFRADLSRDPSTDSPVVLQSYALRIN